MPSAARITVVLGSVLICAGGALGAASALAGDFRHAEEHRAGLRWDGRAYDRHEWERRDWDRHYSDAAGRRRYWDGHAWVYLLPPPLHPGWHWDITLGRYCP